MALKQFYIKNVGPAKIQRVQQKIPGCKMKANFKKSVIIQILVAQVANAVRRVI